MKISKVYRKLAALAAFLLIGTCVYWGAHSYVESKFVQKMASKGIYAKIGEVSLSLDGVLLSDIFLIVRESETSIQEISTNYSLSNIYVNGAFVRGDVEDYLRLRHADGFKTSKSNSSNRVVTITNSAARLTFKGKSVAAEGVEFSTSDDVIRTSTVKIGSFIYLQGASFSLQDNHFDIDTLRVIPKISKNDTGITLKTPPVSELKIPPIQDIKYSAHIASVQGKFKAENVMVSFESSREETHASLSAENFEYGRNDSLVNPDKVLVDVSTVKFKFSGWLKQYKAQISMNDISILHSGISKNQFNIDTVSFDWLSSTDKEDTLIDGTAFINDISIALNFTIHGEGSKGFINFNIALPLTKCQDIVSAIPSKLIETIDVSKFDGRIKASISGASLEETKVKIFTDCKMLTFPAILNPQRFKRAFTVMVGSNQKEKLITGPNTPKWIPLNMMTHYVEPVLLTVEDGRFNSHKGFDSSALARLIKESAKSGEVQRGASTITQQLAKNLWLSRDRTLARKIQEFFLALHLENNLSKADIMELYLNIVEFGPNVYGIYDGAMHYFGIPPMDLTLKQTLFLGSILPKPNGTYFVNGKLGQGTEDKLNYLLKIMNTRGKIDKKELLEGLSELLISR